MKIFVRCGKAAALAMAGVFFFLAASAMAGENLQFVLPQFSEKISLDFKNADLKDILKAISRQMGVNFLTLKEVDVKNVTAFLDNVPLEEALDKILSVNGLTYEFDQEANVFIVKPKGEAEEDTVITRVFPLRYAAVAGSSLNKALSSCGSSGSAASASAGPAMGGTGGGGGSGGIAGSLAPVLTDKGKVIEDPRTNSLIVTDRKKNFPYIEKMIAQLDVPIAQILIEVEILDVNKTALDELGVKYGSTPFQISGASMDTLWPLDEDVFKTSKYYLEDRTATPGSLDASGATIMLQFLKTLTDTKSLSRPRILTLDNQTATIGIQTDEVIGLKITEGTEGEGDTRVAERTMTGVTMTVTPQANLMSGEITLVVEPKVSDAKPSKIEGFYNPEERTMKSILTVKSGETIVIGGLLRSDDSDVVTKLPILGDIPVIGAAFRHKTKAKNERELIIFMTPKIILPTDDMAEAALPVSLQHFDREQTAASDSRMRMIADDMNQASQHARD